MVVVWLLGVSLVSAAVDFHAVLTKESDLLAQAQTLVDAVQSMKDLAAKRPQDSILTQVLRLKSEVDQLETLVDLADNILNAKRARTDLNFDEAEVLAQRLVEVTDTIDSLTAKIKAFDDDALAGKLNEIRKAQDESKATLQKSMEEIQERKQKLEVMVSSDFRVWGLYFILGVVCAILLQTWYTFWRATKTKLP